MEAIFPHQDIYGDHELAQCYGRMKKQPFPRVQTMKLKTNPLAVLKVICNDKACDGDSEHRKG